MKQDFLEGDPDDLDRLFTSLARHDPDPGQVYDETLASLRRWQPVADGRNRLIRAGVLTGLLVALVAVVGVWLAIGNPGFEPNQTVADLVTITPATATAGISPTGSSLPTPATLAASPKVLTISDPLLARLIRLNERETRSQLPVGSSDSDSTYIFWSHTTPSPF